MSQSELSSMVDSKVAEVADELSKISDDIIRTIQIVSYQSVLKLLVDQARMQKDTMDDDLESSEMLEGAGMTGEALTLYARAMETRGKILQSREIAGILQERIAAARTEELTEALGAAREVMQIRDEALGVVFDVT